MQTSKTVVINRRTLILRNITDTEYTYPEPVRRNLAEIPGGAGATAYLSYAYKF